MSTDLVPTFGSRPPVLTINGGVVHVSVHDAEFLRQWRDWRRTLAEAHPDRGGSSKRFRLALRRYRQWEYQEAKWYIAIGIDPPKALHSRTFHNGQFQRVLVEVEAPVSLTPCLHCGKPRMSNQASLSRDFCSASCSRRFHGPTRRWKKKTEGIAA